MNLVSNAAVFSPLRAERTQEERMQMHTAKLDGQRLCPRFCEISPSGVGKGGSLRSESLPTMASTAAEPNHENEARKLHEELFPSGLLQELPDYMLPVGHRVWTRMGRGTVAHNRSDGFQEIELDWTLAGNCKVYLYTNEMLETLFLANSNLEQEPSEDSWADYTNATPFEQFVTDAEFLLKDLGFENKLVVPQPVSPEVQTVPLKYDGVEWSLSVYSYLAGMGKMYVFDEQRKHEQGSSENAVPKYTPEWKDSKTHHYTPTMLSLVSAPATVIESDLSPSFHPLRRYFGVKEFLTLNPPFGDTTFVPASLSRFLMSGIAMALSTIKCTIPIFTPTGVVPDWIGSSYPSYGTIGGCLVFDSKKAMRPPTEHFATLSAATNTFLTKIEAESSSARVTISVRHSWGYAVSPPTMSSHLDGYTGAFGSGNAGETSLRSWWRLPGEWGPLDDPISAITIYAAWPRFPAGAFVDDETYTDLIASQAPEWFVRVKWDSEMHLPLSREAHLATMEEDFQIRERQLAEETGPNGPCLDAPGSRGDTSSTHTADFRDDENNPTGVANLSMDDVSTSSIDNVGTEEYRQGEDNVDRDDHIDHDEFRDAVSTLEELEARRKQKTSSHMDMLRSADSPAVRNLRDLPIVGASFDLGIVPQAEKLLSLATALLAHFPGQFRLVNALLSADGRYPVQIVGEPERRSVEHATAALDGVPPHNREFILRAEVEPPGGSLYGVNSYPQRMYVFSSNREVRVCTSFTEEF